MKKGSTYEAASRTGVPSRTDALDCWGKWKLPIVYRLLDGTKRFGELRRLIPAATQQLLTLQLRELEQAGILHRQVYAQVPPKVEYSLTELGHSLEPIVLQIYSWGAWYCDQHSMAYWHLHDHGNDPL